MHKISGTLQFLGSTDHPAVCQINIVAMAEAMPWFSVCPACTAALDSFYISSFFSQSTAYYLLPLDLRQMSPV